MVKKDITKIPASNYVKLGLIIIVTLVACFALRNTYLSNQEYENGIPIIRSVLTSEINSSEVYHYVRENNDAIIYIGVANNSSCRKLEEELKDTILDRNLENVITYLNLTNTKNKSSFIKEFNKFYDVKLLGYPSFVFIQNGKVVDYITVKEDKNMSVDRVINFLERNNISSELYD